MASVRKREWSSPDGEKRFAWVVTYTDADGKRRLKTFEKKKDADAYRTKVETEIGDGTHLPNHEAKTVAEVARALVMSYQNRHRARDKMSGNTFYSHRSVIENHIIPKFGLRKISSLTFLEIQDFLTGCADGRARSTVVKIQTQYFALFTLAIDSGWLKVSPIAHRKLRLAGRSRAKTLIPAKDEIRWLFNTLQSRKYREKELSYRTRVALLTLALFTGMRRGELAGLRWENVDFAAGLIHVRHSLSRIDGLKEPKTRQSERSVDMVPAVAQLLLRLHEIAGRPTSGYVLRSSQNEHIAVNSIGNAWRALLKSARLLDAAGKPKYKFHALRHAAVSLLIEQGLQPLHIQKVVGHSSVRVTMDVYAHLFPDDRAAKTAMIAAAQDFDVRATAVSGLSPVRQESNKAFHLIEIPH